ncbi:DMT family transporter [Krasilnikovia sp. MM14-A1004]|uniref:DMT family transporter n=1 Tax=Krasilnikovia sp. MM14-A1004 TaxID=3373541 RepID=UPI00399C7C67
MTAWLLLSAAIVSEVIATATLTASNGLSSRILTLVTAALYIVSYVCFARALKAGIEVGVAYAIWSGVGTAALAIIGAALFGEAMNARKIAAIVLIIGGVTLLHLTGRPEAPARAASSHGSESSLTTASEIDRRASP